jgi:uncharacterized protein (DUF1778 family)
VTAHVEDEGREAALAGVRAQDHVFAILMSDDQTEISAYVSATTKRRLDEFARETGLKKGYILEQALDSYLSSSEAIPEEYLVPSVIVLTNESYDRVVEQMLHPEEPTPALRALLRGELGADQAPEGF